MSWSLKSKQETAAVAAVYVGNKILTLAEIMAVGLADGRNLAEKPSGDLRKWG